jgi:hypothetical protein
MDDMKNSSSTGTTWFDGASYGGIVLGESK